MLTFDIEGMLFTLFAPEFAASAAIGDWYKARRDARRCKERGLANWTLTHSFLLGMDGIRLINTDCAQPNTGGKKRCVPERLLHLDGVTAAILHRKGVLPRELSELTVEDISDRSKANGLIKVIASVQALWFVVQCAGRAAQGLHITALEIVTPGFVLCALVNYIMWYHKPLDVCHGVVARYVCSRPDGSHVELNAGNDKRSKGLDRLSIDLTERAGVITIALFVAFGAVHCAAWNADFPTPIEQLLWRVAAVLTMGVPLLWSPLEAVDMPGWSGHLKQTAIAVILYVYVIARLYLVAEMFAGLRAQPPGCYESVEWVKFLPHFG